MDGGRGSLEQPPERGNAPDLLHKMFEQLGSNVAES